VTEIRRDPFGYCNLDGEVAVSMNRLIVDYTEWRELVKEYEGAGRGDVLTMTREAMDRAFELMEPYLPCVLHYPSGRAETFGTTTHVRMGGYWGRQYQVREKVGPPRR
jgi:hypothetical protein